MICSRNSSRQLNRKWEWILTLATTHCILMKKKYSSVMRPVWLPPANKVCKGYVFTPVCHSVHGGGISGPGLGGCASQHALKQTPPSRRLLLRVVRILLECFLVVYSFSLSPWLLLFWNEDKYRSLHPPLQGLFFNFVGIRQYYFNTENRISLADLLLFLCPA